MNNINEYIKSLPVTIEDIDLRTGFATIENFEVSSVKNRNLNLTKVIDLSIVKGKNIVRYAEETEEGRDSTHLDFLDINTPVRRFKRHLISLGMVSIDLNTYYDAQLIESGIDITGLSFEDKINLIDSEDFRVEKSLISI